MVQCSVCVCVHVLDCGEDRNVECPALSFSNIFTEDRVCLSIFCLDLECGMP